MTCRFVSTTSPRVITGRHSLGGEVSECLCGRPSKGDAVRKLSVVDGTMNEAGRCANTHQPLAHSLDSSKEGLAMEAIPCSIDGCEKPAGITRGWCSMHYWRWNHHGDVLWEPPARITECTVVGCHGAPQGRGLCSKHFSRLRRTGSVELLPRNVDYGARFWSKVDKESDGGGCWLWQGTILGTGYGQFATSTKKYLAHRFAYELAKGAIADGLTVDHVWNWGCRYRHCVNPDHLQVVTQAENNRRARSVTRQREAEAGR